MFRLNDSITAKGVIILKCTLASIMAFGLFLGSFGQIEKAQAQTTCRATADGPWSADIIWDCGTAPMTIAANEVVEIDSNVNVTLDDTVEIEVNGALNVHGRLVILAAGKIINNQFMNVLGQVESHGAVENRELLSVSGSYHNLDQASLESTDRVFVSGRFTNDPQAVVEVNDGFLDISGLFTNSGTLNLTSPAAVTVSGNLNNQSGGTIDSSGGTITVPSAGTIDNSGLFTNTTQSLITNAGQINNYDGGNLQSSDQGSQIINQDGGMIHNNGGKLLNWNSSLIDNQPRARLFVASGVVRNTTGAGFANQGLLRIALGGSVDNQATVLNHWCTSSIVVAGQYRNHDFTQTAPGKINVTSTGQLLGNPPFVTPGCAP